MNLFKQLVLFTIILFCNYGVSAQMDYTQYIPKQKYNNKHFFKEQDIPRYDISIGNTVNVRDIDSYQFLYAQSSVYDMHEPFTEESPSVRTLNGLLNPMALPPGNVEADDLGDPNGQGPGIGTRLPVAPAHGFLALLILAYIIRKYNRIRKIEC